MVHKLNCFVLQRNTRIRKLYIRFTNTTLYRIKDGFGNRKMAFLSKNVEMDRKVGKEWRYFLKKV